MLVKDYIMAVSISKWHMRSYKNVAYKHHFTMKGEKLCEIDSLFEKYKKH